MKKYVAKNIDDKLILCDLDKLIGEISPEATWVKAGDEFDEDELRFHYRVKDGSERVFPITHSWSQKLLHFVQVKGQCGHFY